ncbi:spliceosome-associated protein 49 [Quercus suber]|uniref:Spliceosome-associated protein 49 n=1 Tax=Quercus suber TaxID=58331 RepID=A0AAW0LNR7_QUESU
MSGNSDCKVYVGNLDERVSDRVLYDILIQAGRVVDLYIPRDKETDKPKGFALQNMNLQRLQTMRPLFSGLVSLYNRTLKFAVRPCFTYGFYLLCFVEYHLASK